MNRINLGQSIQTLANLGVLAGIAFLAFELKEMNRATQEMNQATQLATAENHAERANAIDRLIFENPRLENYDNPANFDPNDPNYSNDLTQLIYLNRMRLRSWQTTFYEYSLGVLDESFFELYVNEIRNELRFNDGLVNIWTSAGQSLYGSEFLNFLNSQLEQVRPDYESPGLPGGSRRERPGALDQPLSE